MKKFIKWVLRILGCILLLWLILAQIFLKFRTSDKDAAADFAEASVKFKPVYLQIGDRVMHYVIAGNDTLPTIVFIHGSPGSWDAFEQYMLDHELLQKYRMISIDRPGFGYSGYGDALNFDKQAALLDAVLRNIENGKPMALVGHSLGGPMIVKLAAENPGIDIQNLVVLAGSVEPAMETPEKWRNVLDFSPLKFFIPGAMRPSNSELRMFKKDVYSLAADFPKITCNVVIIQGDSDQLVPPHNSVFLQQQLIHAKSVRMIWLKGENHFIPWTRFEDIKHELLGLQFRRNMPG